MAKGLSPIIGLAVVMALALAAVFGSMSLANPAMAAIGQPADAELTERTFYPATPEGVTTAVASGEVTLSWTAQTGFEQDHYQVRWKESTQSDYFQGFQGNSNANVDITPDTGDATGATIDGLTNGATYNFQVRSTKDGVISDPSTEISATPNTAPGGTPAVTAVAGGPGEVVLTWTFAGTGSAVTSWEYSTVVDDSAWMLIPGSDGSTRSYTVTGLTAGSHDFRVRGLAAGGIAGTPSARVAVDDVVGATVNPTLEAGGSTPASAVRYTLEFTAGGPISGLDGQIELEMEDFGVPSSIDTKNIVIRVCRDLAAGDSGATDDPCDALNQPSNPQDIETDDEEIIIHVGDVNPGSDNDTVDSIEAGDVVTITIQSNAGVTLPTEGGGFAWKVDDVDTDEITVRRKVSLDEDDGGRGDMLTATGKGFKNGTSIHFWLDADKDGRLDPEEFTLCSSTVGGDDVGKCEFEVAVPPFVGGKNYVNAIDGRSNRAFEDAEGAISDGDNREDHEFILESSIKATPDGGTPGESMLVELFDIPEGAGSNITKVELARQVVCGGMPPGETDVVPCQYGAVNQGSASFRLVIPDWAPGGIQDLRVTVGTGDDKDDPSKTVTITPPLIRSTPTTVVANQRISLVGSGFNSGASICDNNHPNAVMSIGGDDISCARVNGGAEVHIDNGGNWSAAVDLPLDDSTVDEGTYEIRVRDSVGRVGTVEVTIPARTVTITPESGRVGTVAVVRGENWPGKNDEGDSFSVEIVYESAYGKTTVSAQPDASGAFESQLRIPTTAGIPSTNTVKVSYEFGANNSIRTTAVSHDVPEGIIGLSTTSGGPGSTVTIDGEGFKSFVPVASVFIGALDITPAPKPSTDGNGMMSFDVTIPGLDVGIQTVEVQVGQTTASTGFTVTESGVAPGDIKPVAEAIEELGTNLVSVWNFNNDTKVWAFYDPTLAEGNTLTHMITGETYLIRVQSDQAVILNRDTRSLTCVGGNCWNQVVW